MWTAALDRLTSIVRDTFPTVVVYLPGGEAPGYSVTGVYDEAHKVWSPDQPGVSTTEVLFTVKLSDMQATPKAYDRLTIGSVMFKVTEVRPDGSGMAGLVLEEVA